MGYNLRGITTDQEQAWQSLKLYMEEVAERININVEQAQNGLGIERCQEYWMLRCASVTGFCRGMSLIEQFKHEAVGFAYEEKPKVNNLGVMIDCSRNAVPHLEGLKKMLTHLARMGYNTVQLYTEDTYQIEEMPFFGYMRGAYSLEELKKIDQFAARLGIEMIPCIQTLAHLKHALKWEAFEDYIDCDDILLCGDEQTYAFIEKMFATMSLAFSSRQINIGMDEAHMVGLGKYLDQHGYQDRVGIIMNHLERVLKIAQKYNYEVMMWSDMFFRLLNQGEYYVHGQPLDRSMLKRIPEGIQLLYWDYYTRDYAVYDQMLQRHKEIGRKIIFAGGAWKWAGFTPMNQESIRLGETAAAAIFDHHIQDILITCWGDNGAEASMFSVLPTLMVWAELCWSQKKEIGWIENRFSACTRGDYKDVLAMDEVNQCSEESKYQGLGANPSKYLFYQDPLLGLVDFMDVADRWTARQQQVSQRLEAISQKSSPWQTLFEVQHRLSVFLELKASLGCHMREAYEHRDQKRLERMAREVLPEVIQRLSDFQEAYRRQWHKENKVYGLEAFDIRTGALKERLYQAKARIESYLSGAITGIDELECQVMPMQKEKVEGVLMSGVHWEEIVSAANLYGV